MTESQMTLARTEAPDSARSALLSAARTAFAERGLEGARVDDIARRAGVNKQLVYHYFGSKDALYTAVLKEVYQEIRDQERGLELGSLPPRDAMRTLIEFSFDYLEKSPAFVRILADENAHRGQHLQGSDSMSDVNRPIIDLLRETLLRGEREKVFRSGLDPLQVYLSIAGMSFFYFANIYTLTRAFDPQLGTKAGAAERKAQIVEFALAAIERHQAA